MPGISITTNVRSGPSAGTNPPSGQFFAVGMFERGDTTAPVLLRSIADLKRNFGDSNGFSNAWDQIYTFFAEGGNQAYVVRVAGPAATAGTLSLVDRAQDPDTPAPTLVIHAASPGAWSSNLQVQVSDGPTPTTYRLTVTLNGSIVEDYNNLTSPDDAVAKFAASPYIRVTNAGSTTAAPNNNPVAASYSSLSAGEDDRDSVVSDNYIAALDLFGIELLDGAVAIPGQVGADVYNALIQHAKDNNRIALLAGARGDTVTNLQASVSGLNSEYAGFFAPWVVVPTSGTATKAISPEGYVAAMRSRAHVQVGPWRAPAGAFAKSQYVLDVDQVFKASDADTLDDSKISVIRKVAGTVRLYGWRSTSNDTDDWAFLKDRDTLNRIVTDAGQRLEQYVFSPIDGRGYLLSQINAELVGMLDPMAQADGLFATYDSDGNEVDPGYVVDTGSTINSESTLAQGIINAQIGVRISPVGSIINLVVTKVGLLGSLS